MELSFGERLRQKRRAGRISQRRLAELVDLDFTYVAKLESGRTGLPAPETVLRVADLLGCPAEELLPAA